MIPTIRERTDAATRMARLSRRFDDVEGWLSPEQGFLLHELARLGPGTGAVVEIGSFKGRSACWLAAGIGERGNVWCVDHFKGSVEHALGGPVETKEIVETGSTFPVFERNLRAKDLRWNVCPIRASSLEAAAEWRLPIRLLFIDAGHSYHEVKADFTAWERFLEPTALVAFHDVGEFLGVNIYYEELLASGLWHEVAAVDTLRVISREKA